MKKKNTKIACGVLVLATFGVLVVFLVVLGVPSVIGTLFRPLFEHEEPRYSL